MTLYVCGVGGPVGCDDQESLPRFWCAQQEVESAFKDPDFERMCAEMECAGQGDIARSLRQHENSLLTKVEATRQSIEQERERATREVNQLCCKFIGTSLPDLRWGERIGWAYLNLGLFPDGSAMGGDPDRRKRLSEFIQMGLPRILEVDQKLADDPKVVAAEYWSILSDAARKIQKLRHRLRSEVERVCVFLTTVERAGEAARRTNLTPAERAAKKAARESDDDDRTTSIGKRGARRKPARTDNDEYRPAAWFPKGMAPRLRMAAQKARKTKRVARKWIDGVTCYSVADARRWWPKDVPAESK